MKKTFRNLALTAVIGTALIGGVALAESTGNMMGGGYHGGNHGQGHGNIEFTGPGADKLNALRDKHHAEMTALMKETGWTHPNMGTGDCTERGPGETKAK